MNIIHRIATVLVGLVVVGSASAQTKFLPTESEARKSAEGIVASVASGNPSGSLKELKPISVIPESDFAVFEAQFNSQQENLLRQFGAATGYEFIRLDKGGSRLLRYTFLVFHEKAPLRWTFVFYKAEKGWVLSHFAFDGNAIQYFPSLLGGANPAVYPVRFALWTLRDEAAQRRSPPHWAVQDPPLRADPSIAG